MEMNKFGIIIQKQQIENTWTDITFKHRQNLLAVRIKEFYTLNT